MHRSPAQVGAPLSRLWILHKAWAKQSDSLQTCLLSPPWFHVTWRSCTDCFSSLFSCWDIGTHHLWGCCGHRCSHCSRGERRGRSVRVFKSLLCLWLGEGLWKTLKLRAVGVEDPATSWCCCCQALCPGGWMSQMFFRGGRTSWSIHSSCCPTYHLFFLSIFSCEKVRQGVFPLWAGLTGEMLRWQLNRKCDKAWRSDGGFSCLSPLFLHLNKASVRLEISVLWHSASG